MAKSHLTARDRATVWVGHSVCGGGRGEYQGDRRRVARRRVARESGVGFSTCQRQESVCATAAPFLLIVIEKGREGVRD